MVLTTQFVHLTSGHLPNLRLRERGVTTRHRKVIAMYTAKVRMRPIQCYGYCISIRGMQPISEPTFRWRASELLSASCFHWDTIHVMASLLGWRVREPVNAATESANHRWSAVSPFADPLKMEIR